METHVPKSSKSLPARPNRDHLRRQAKSLLADLHAGSADAVATFKEFLPSARKLSAAAMAKTDFRLADAQSAIARKSGFESWPALARYVDQLRALEGEWAFAKLEVDGVSMPVAAMGGSKLLIDGDRFRMESPGSTYEGVFSIDVEADPHRIDIEFIEGPEAGNWNYGIFRLDKDQLEICLNLNGKAAPGAFRSAPASGTAYEVLSRTSPARPHDVKGGTRSAATAPPAEAAIAAGFEGYDSPLLRELQGNWSAVKVIRDGEEFPSMMLKTGRRVAKGNEVEIHFGGQLIIRAKVRLDESASPIHVDYLNLHGPAKGMIQHGIVNWDGTEARFLMAPPGAPRPDDFSVKAGDGRTLSHWRKA